MKKLTLALLAVLMTATLTLTACSSKDTPPQGGTDVTPDTEQATDDNQPVTEDNEEPAPVENNATLEEFVAEIQESIDAMNAALGGIMEMNISARGNALVYTYTILSEDIQLDQATMDAQVDSLSASFDMIKSTMEDEYGISAPSIVIEFVDADGNEISSVTY